MSWYVLANLPEQVVEDINAQEWSKSGWSCGCWPGKDDDGTPLVWFCQYHQGYYDGIREQEQIHQMCEHEALREHSRLSQEMLPGSDKIPAPNRPDSTMYPIKKVRFTTDTTEM